ncbi:hypothetical protein AKJ54_00180 [candidate division MSBL1 archaeon SCGC-AAA382K21]|uniref:Uncharacterized protein n=1 Tax=candidate division MSBL1 archaeon SCGC-AAA382K21 TaxID=1698283 RepID=A0A133VLZ0_9EURY|nr:hypothetical protein AKJ54_00180 [candidate division MSBL1 archaeon SCGC-AAA382K21]
MHNTVEKIKEHEKHQWIWDKYKEDRKKRSGERRKKTKSILEKLKKASKKRIINDAISKGGKFTLYRQRGGGYRPIAMLEKMYDSTGLVPINYNILIL